MHHGIGHMVTGQNHHLPPPLYRTTTPPTSGHYAQAGGTHPTGIHVVFIQDQIQRFCWLQDPNIKLQIDAQNRII